MSPLELWPIGAIRRNHALEHATINVLSESSANLRLVGRSDWAGFTLYGPVGSDEVEAAVAGALDRLRAGESELAVHPSCGTNFATGYVLTALASYAALRGKRRSGLEKVLQLVLGVGAALLLAQPVGVKIQEYVTTSVGVGLLRVKDIRRLQLGKVIIHRIDTAQE